VTAGAATGGTAAANGPLWGARARDWAEVQEPTARAAFQAVLERLDVGRGQRLLDIGCGAGLLAAMAAARGAETAGVDASDALLAIARERTPQGDFRLAEMQALPFADHSFDLTAAVNALQYAADPVAAMLEAGRVTRPGGVVAVVVWGEPEGMPMADVIAALRPLLPPPPVGGGPFALSGAATLRRLAKHVGLMVMEVQDIPATIVYPDLATALRGLNASGVAARAIQVAGEDAVTAAHTAALSPFRASEGTYRIAAGFRLLLARV
jgi:SAM-dependent methyltransferase